MEGLLSNFASPVVLAFVLGILAKAFKSDLEIPKPLYQGLCIYLLLAIEHKGTLVLFLLELGMVTARRLQDLRKVGVFLLGFGVIVPILFGALAVWAGQLAGLSIAGSAVLAAMVSSGSYIAAPAAVRIALPKANPTLYLTASLGITFPFNITLGIPLYLEIAYILGG